MNCCPLASLISAVAALFICPFALDAAEVQWFAGAAKVDITPEYPVRLAGYGSRNTESEGVAQRIFAKALALRVGDGPVAVLITVDNCAVRGRLRDEIARRLLSKRGVRDESLAICSSHTHSAPVLEGALPTLFGADIPPAHLASISRYTRELTDNLEQVALSAIDTAQPSTVAWEKGR